MRRNGKVLSAQEVQAFKDKVIEMYANGQTLTQICKDLETDPSTIAYLRTKDTVFDSECLSAQNIGFEIQADTLHTIYDEEEDVNKARGKSDNIKWLLTKRHASKYGDRIDLNVTNSIDLKGALIDAQDRLKKLPQNTQSQIEQTIDITPISNEPTTSAEPVAETDSDAILLQDILK